MITTVTFNTHKFIKKLHDAGFQEQQAEAMTETLAAVLNETVNICELVTKQDLDARSKELELRLDAQISNLKYEMIKWFSVMMLVQTGVIVALVKLLWSWAWSVNQALNKQQNQRENNVLMLR